MNEKRLLSILAGLSNLRILVIGDLFLDKYLIINEELTEKSLETGLDAYQVVRLRPLPGAAGTVAKDLRALGVEVAVISAIGDDGEGYDLRRALQALGVNIEGLIIVPTRYTPTYMKPILHKRNGEERELNRLDIKNRQILPSEVEEEIIAALHRTIPKVDGVAICDQVAEQNCGVITERVRKELQSLAIKHPNKVFIADSRARISLFKDVFCKPNIYEAAQAVGGDPKERNNPAALYRWGKALRKIINKPIFITAAERGIFIFPDSKNVLHVPAIPVEEPIDVVGAGDAVMTGLLTSLCCGATLEEAAFIGSLTAAVTIKQLGTTGEATPEQIVTEFQKWWTTQKGQRR